MLDKNYLYNKWMDIFYSIYFAEKFKSNLPYLKDKKLPQEKLIKLGSRFVSVERNPTKKFKTSNAQKIS